MTARPAPTMRRSGQDITHRLVILLMLAQTVMTRFVIG